MPMEIVQQALMITCFVGVMMLLVDYLNVQTQGMLLTALQGSRWRQYTLSVVLGAIPGCLGAFAVVALYTHRKVSLGAVVAAMIATSGDEAFIMLTLFPGTAALMTLALAVLGAVAGWSTDQLLRRRPAGLDDRCPALTIHDVETCRCFSFQEVLAIWRPPTRYRAVLAAAFVAMIVLLAAGLAGPPVGGWKYITLLTVTGFGLFVVASVPDHFLEAHLWRHVAVRHVPRIFFWTFGVLAVLTALERMVDLPSVISANLWTLLGISAVLGIVPESGPHLVFVTMYADGLIPLSILFTSSVVQDGHGMLPLLSASKRAFVLVKLSNLIVGLVVGAVLLALGL